jgi:hypothetical protein
MSSFAKFAGSLRKAQSDIWTISSLSGCPNEALTCSMWRAFYEPAISFGEIEPGKNAGEWKVKVVGWLDGTTRKMGVVVIVIRERQLLVKTTEWEDR